MTPLPIRRRALLAAPLAVPASRVVAQPDWPRRVTDLLGRAVTIPARPRAVLLGEGFNIVNLALIHPDPASILVGMGGERRRVDPLGDAAYRRAFPALDRVREVTGAVGQGFGTETALALRPDLVILSLWHRQSEEMNRTVAFLEGRGVPVIYVDLFQRPELNTVPTMRLLGQALGVEERAEAYARFYEERRDRILAKVAGAGPGPRVLSVAFPGRWPCCWTPGDEGGNGGFLRMLGARNLAAPWLPSPRGGNVSPENVATSGAEVFIGTGIYLPEEPATGIQVGTGAPADRARASLEAVLRLPELRLLPAATNGRAHGIWNPFNGAAMNICAFEAMARWVRPDLFGDVDPAATLAEINARFAAVPYEGAYWTGV